MGADFQGEIKDWRSGIDKRRPYPGMKAGRVGRESMKGE